MTTSPILPGAEPFSAAGGPHGVLVVHGFTGSPQSMRRLAAAFAAAGFAVELPLLPGHGTAVEDMAATGWADWSAAVEDAYTDLAERVDRVAVAGLSMGGSLAVWLGARHPEIAGLVLINPAVGETDLGLRDGMRQLLDAGTDFVPGVGNDVADPDVVELAYDHVPVASLLSLLEAGDDLRAVLGDVACPILLFTSRQDHVVPPESAAPLLAEASGPVEQVFLERSFHVATIDYDKEEIERRAVDFAREVTSPARPRGPAR